MSLAKVGLINTVYLCKLDTFFLERRGSFLVVRRKSFTMTAPTDQDVEGEELRWERCTNHGAKNSTRIKGSGFMTDSKVTAVMSNTSESGATDASEVRTRIALDRRY